jgi:hypothetical protein
MALHGYFRLSMHIEALPVNMRSWHWDIAGDHWIAEGSANTDLISYRELIDLWERGEISLVGKFEELLLIACKGLEARDRFICNQ